MQETGAQRAQADHAMQLLQDYKQRWLPVQQKLASTIQQEGKPDSAARRLAAGKSSTDVAMSFDKAGGALEKSLSNAGVSPGSSRANLAVTGLGTDAAGSTGIGHVMSDQAVDDAYTQGLGALTALGRGERAQVGQNMSTQAQASAQQASADAQAALMEREGNAAMIGQVAGFGLQRAMAPGQPDNPQGIGDKYSSPSLLGGMFGSSMGMNPSGINNPTRGGQ